MLCGLFAACLFSGGVFNAIYAVDNADTIDDYQTLCDQHKHYSVNNSIHGLCDDLRRVRNAEVTAAVS